MDQEGIDRGTAIERREIIGERRPAASGEAEGLDQGAAVPAILGRLVERFAPRRRSGTAAPRARHEARASATPIASDTPATTTVRERARGGRAARSLAPSAGNG